MLVHQASHQVDEAVGEIGIELLARKRSDLGSSSSMGDAGAYGRPCVSASKTSASATILACSG
jgi:hypothetical protein